MSQEVISFSDYDELLQQTVAVLNNTRNSIARNLAFNINEAHREIGRLLAERKLDSRHGAGVVVRLSEDLKRIFPKMGMSPRNLWNMKKFYLRFYQSDTKLQHTVAVLPWGHVLRLMSEFKEDDAAILYYATETINKGWSRDLLTNAIKLKMHERFELECVNNNFRATLPEVRAEYANTVLKSTYNLGFLGATEPMLELELEHRILERIKLFLLELGKGFAFIGNQYPIEYKGSNGIIDLLLYHRGLRCLVAIELKAGKFRPEYAGKMNYYLSILDRTERNPEENPSIGIILCAEKDHVDVELSLDGLDKPIGVSDYQLLIPKDQLREVVRKELETFEEESEE